MQLIVTEIKPVKQSGLAYVWVKGHDDYLVVDLTFDPSETIQSAIDVIQSEFNWTAVRIILDVVRK